MSWYLDASVLVPTLVQQSATAPVEAYLRASRQERLISDFAAAEVGSALSRLVRMGLMSNPEAAARLADFDAWRAATSSTADVHASDVRLAYVYVHRFDLMLRAPDALHLAMARRLDATLFTLDRRLVNAGQALGIMVEVPEAGA